MVYFSCSQIYHAQLTEFVTEGFQFWRIGELLVGKKKIGVGKFATTPRKILTELADTDYWFVTNAVFHVTQLYYNTKTDHDAICYCNHKSNSAMYLEYSGFNPRYKIFFTWAFYCTMHSLRQVFTLLNHLLYFIYALVIARQ